ncbi:hypothetical protein CLOLEP_02665 [[Clostridium] leptum DSM 753]|uniref:Uncharacterized protein n=1 Tax=[Clostridium] leptum DSM 753 TaxID=428125 RepID=A7VVQ3_9FIRM|nr:hypothetical protein CLOLEP_02665 [[Clostridium] leptum DSM 753]
MCFLPNLWIFMKFFDYWLHLLVRFRRQYRRKAFGGRFGFTMILP